MDYYRLLRKAADLGLASLADLDSGGQLVVGVGETYTRICAELARGFAVAILVSAAIAAAAKEISLTGIAEGKKLFVTWGLSGSPPARESGELRRPKQLTAGRFSWAYDRLLDLGQFVLICATNELPR